MRYVFIFAAVLLLASCGGRGKSAASAADEAQVQVVELSDSIVEYRKADTISFGRVRRGEKVVREIAFGNAGDKALVITRLDLSCGCVDADYPRRPLMPGDRAPATLTLDTRDLSGWVFKTVGVRTSLDAKSYTLCITAEVE